MVTLLEHLRSRLIDAQLREDEAEVADIRSQLDSLVGASVRETR